MGKKTKNRLIFTKYIYTHKMRIGRYEFVGNHLCWRYKHCNLLFYELQVVQIFVIAIGYIPVNSEFRNNYLIITSRYIKKYALVPHD